MTDTIVPFPAARNRFDEPDDIPFFEPDDLEHRTAQQAEIERLVEMVRTRVDTLLREGVEHGRDCPFAFCATGEWVADELFKLAREVDGQVASRLPPADPRGIPF